jgi:hypothetical protein
MSPWARIFFHTKQKSDWFFYTKTRYFIFNFYLIGILKGHIIINFLHLLGQDIQKKKKLKKIWSPLNDRSVKNV